SDIDRPGPFSAYPGFDRLLLPLAAGLRLGFDGATPQPVPILRPIAFDGGTPTEATLDADASGKKLQVFNLLMRRGVCTGRLQAHAGSGRWREAGAAVIRPA
ncbi:MAG TPA: HutD family protein, partial [Vineibacter sp.]|nr:HutD family protein [Vineibacter sp.]